MSQSPPAIRLGTCAWSFDDWRSVFYPDHLPSGERLKYYARHFSTVEVDSTFYHPPAPHVSAHWAEVTPLDFLFSLKLSREITHERKLREWRQPFDEFLTGLQPLRSKLATVFVQLPPYFELKHDEQALRDFVRHLPRDVRFAIEFRDPSWHLPRIAHLLEEHSVCWVWNDVTAFEQASEGAFGFWPQTTDFIYLRLLGDLESKYDPEKGERMHHYRELMWARDDAIENWAEKVRAASEHTRPILIYSANHFEGFAPATAVRLGQKLGMPLELPTSEEMRGLDPNQLALFE
ncbi:MAG TPA: DUF72 domain-containing protein [Chthoniobacteraceae bacterium]|nr:DUF72 domain-containing protein [Chthoniobacteraceae bacterium]